MKKFVLVMVASLLLISMTLFHTNSVSAHSQIQSKASSFCYQWSCEGLNPSPNCLAGDKEIWYEDIYDDSSSNYTYLGRAEMWWSPSCEAVWTNVHTANNRKAGMFAAIYGNCGSTCSYEAVSANTQVQNAHTGMIPHFSGNCYDSQGDIERIYADLYTYATVDFPHCF